MIEIIPISISKKIKKFNLYDTLISSDVPIRNNDVIVLSSKFVAMSEGSIININKIRPSNIALKLAKQYTMDPKITEIILREADQIFSGIPGFLLSITNGILAPNAGIDSSNIFNNHVICFPKEPFKSANNLRINFLVNMGIHVGIIISDSRLMPTRVGTTGMAISCSGLEPVEDHRAKKDLFGNTIKYTFKAVADSLATMATFAMGESNESIPFVIIRGANVIMTNKRLSWNSFAVNYDTDIYFRGLSS
ncbi:MAG: coenzyme F420-0:L-glutamate ligase [Nitrososphaeraceae archaeon]